MYEYTMRVHSERACSHTHTQSSSSSSSSAENSQSSWDRAVGCVDSVVATWYSSRSVDWTYWNTSTSTSNASVNFVSQDESWRTADRYSRNLKQGPFGPLKKRFTSWSLQIPCNRQTRWPWWRYRKAYTTVLYIDAEERFENSTSLPLFALCPVAYPGLLVPCILLETRTP
jgi:hypothetical protein